MEPSIYFSDDSDGFQAFDIRAQWCRNPDLKPMLQLPGVEQLSSWREKDTDITVAAECTLKTFQIT